MTWDDLGYLLYKNKYNENSLIAEIYTKNHGKVSGIIFGGTSRKIKNYLQIGNNIHVNFNSKLENRAGSFKVEIQEALSPYYFDNRKKLSCIFSAMSLIKILTAEAQVNESIYRQIEEFYTILKSENWIKDYIFWELNLFKILGYDLQIENLVDKKIVNSQTVYMTKSLSSKKIIPNFLIEKNDEKVELEILLNGFNLVSDYLDKSILKPNNLTQPISRLDFINSLK